MVRTLIVSLIAGGVALIVMPQVRHSITVANAAYAEGLTARTREGWPVPGDPRGAGSQVQLAITAVPPWLDGACMVAGCGLALAGLLVGVKAMGATGRGEFGARLARAREQPGAAG